MARVHFTQELIADIRRRVIDHNDRARVEGVPLTKLGELKKLYERNYRGEKPGESAIRAIETHLTKAFDPGKHPRGGRGEFSSKGSLSVPLPAAVEAHQEKQATNAGYRALTTDVIPETRNEFIGTAARNIGSLALGAGVIASLARGRPNGLVERLASRVGGAVVKQVAAVPVAVAAHSAAAGLKAARLERLLSHTTATRVADAAASGGQRVGRKAGAWATRGVGYAVRGGIHLSGARSARMGHPVAARIRRAATFAGLSLIPAHLINEETKDSSLDPAVWGRGIDATTYRTIQKMAASEELGAARHEIMEQLRKSESADDLRKALPGLYSRYGKILLSGLAGVAGAGTGRTVARRAAAIAGASAAGAAAGDAIGESEGKGNPYHDSRGRFTSRSSASGAVGAVAGAALAGGAALLALRRHNVTALRAATHNLGDQIAEATNDALRGGSRFTEHGQLVANRQRRINELLLRDKQYAERMAAIRRHGGHALVHYQGKIRDEINGKIADILSAHDAVRLPVSTSSGRVWKTLGDIRGGEARQELRGAKAHQAVADAVDRLTPADFQKAISDLPENVQADATRWFQRRAEEVGKVEPTLAGHHQALDEAYTARDEASERTSQAQARLDSARMSLRAADASERPAAQQRHDEAVAGFKVAADEEKAAQERLSKLNSKGLAITSAVTGKKIPPASEMELSERRNKLTADALGRAERKADAEIAKARAEHVFFVTNAGNRRLAAQALIGQKAGAIPKSAKAAAADLLKTHGAFRRVEARMTAAKADRDNAGKQLDILKQLRRGRRPKGLSAEDAASIRENADRIRQAHEEAERRLYVAQGDLEQVRGPRNEAAKAYLDAMTAKPVKVNRRPRLPSFLSVELKRDLLQASRGMTAPAAAFLRSPAGARLKAFAESMANRGKAAGTTARRAATNALRDTYRELFMRQGQNGQWHVAPGKIAVRSGLALPVIAGGQEALSYAKAKLFGSDAEKRGARLPKQFKFEHQVDGVTGHGFTAITVPDESQKGERLVLWGQRYRDLNGTPEKLHPGGRISAVRQRVAEQHQQNQQRQGQPQQAVGHDAPGLKNEDKTAIDAAVGKARGANKLHTAPSGDGGQITYRDHTAHEHDEIANRFLNHVRNQVANNQTQNALAGVFSNQGRILTARQAYEAVTGYRNNGDKAKGKPALGMDVSGFASSDPEEVGQALSDVISANGKRAATDARLKANLHRVIAVAGVAKKLPKESLDALHARLESGAEPAAPEPVTKRAEAPTPVAEAVPTSRSKVLPLTAQMPDFWDESHLRNVARQAASSMASQYGMTSLDEQVHLTHFLEMAAKAMHHAFPGEDITEAEGVEAANAAIERHMESALEEGDEVHRDATANALWEGDLDFFTPEMLDQTRAVVDDRDPPLMRKGSDLDDIDALAKAYLPLAKDAEEEGLSAGAKAVKEIAEGGIEQAQGAVRRSGGDQTQRPQSFLAPVRVANELGSGLAADTAWAIASKVAQRFIPGGAVLGAAEDAVQNAGIRGALSGLASRAAGAITWRNAAIQGGGLAASTVGGYAGGKVAQAGVDALSGRPQKYAPPQETASEGVGRLAGGIAGNLGGMAAGEVAGKWAGGVLGGVLGAPLGPLGSAAAATAGSIAAGALGSWAGGELGSRAAKYFSGYDAGTVQRATARYAGRGHVGTAAALAQRISSGGRGGDPYHDPAGRFTTSSGGAA